MKNSFQKSFACILALLLCGAALAACAANPAQSTEQETQKSINWNGTDLPVDLSAQSSFSKEDLESAVDAIMVRFAQFGDGFTMQRIDFDHDCTADEVDWLNQHMSAPGVGSFVEGVCFLSDFHSPEAPEEVSWNSDADYTGWNWWLARTDGGDWVVVDMGY